MNRSSSPTASFQTYFLYFFLYSVIGWCYEVFLEVVVYHTGFTNRGFLFGPYTPVYGCGALLFLWLLSGLKKKGLSIGGIPITPIVIFVAAGLIATAVELLTSYALDWVTSEPLWDYASYPMNFHGRIALNPSVRFGLGGVFFLYILQPLFEKATARLSRKQLNLISGLLAGLMATDLLFKIIRMI